MHYDAYHHEKATKNTLKNKNRQLCTILQRKFVDTTNYARSTGSTPGAKTVSLVVDVAVDSDFDVADKLGTVDSIGDARFMLQGSQS